MGKTMTTHFKKNNFASVGVCIQMDTNNPKHMMHNVIMLTDGARSYRVHVREAYSKENVDEIVSYGPLSDDNETQSSPNQFRDQNPWQQSNHLRPEVNEYDDYEDSEEDFDSDYDIYEDREDPRDQGLDITTNDIVVYNNTDEVVDSPSLRIILLYNSR